MNRITLKLAALLLLSTGYVMAQRTATNPLKDATKTNLVCSCNFNGQILFAICSHENCDVCCAAATGQ